MLPFSLFRSTPTCSFSTGIQGQAGKRGLLSPDLRPVTYMNDDEVFPTKGTAIVHTANLCEGSGGCDKCPGFLRAAEAEMTELDPEELIFCIHWCHRESGTA